MTKPPVAPVVTDEMVQAAISAYDHECEHFDTETQGALDMHTSAMRAAITAAIEASGELERLRQEHAFMKDQIQKLDQIMTNSIKENDGPNRVNIDGVWYEGPVVENYFKVLRKMQEAYRLVLEMVS